MRPCVVLVANRLAVREAVARYRATSPRIFGSVLRGQDHDGSDIDLLVDALPGATLFDLGGLQEELQSLLGLRRSDAVACAASRQGMQRNPNQ